MNKLIASTASIASFLLHWNRSYWGGVAPCAVVIVVRKFINALAVTMTGTLGSLRENRYAIEPNLQVSITFIKYFSFDWVICRDRVMSDLDIILAVHWKVINLLSNKVKAELLDLIEKWGQSQVAESIEASFLILDEGLFILITIVIKSDTHITKPAGLSALDLPVRRHILLS